MPIVPAAIAISIMRGTIGTVSCAASRMGAPGVRIRGKAEQSGEKSRSFSRRLCKDDLRFKGRVIDLAADTASLGHRFKQILIKAETFQFLVLLRGELPPAAADGFIEHLFRQTAAELDNLSRRETFCIARFTRRVEFFSSKNSLAISATSEEDVKSVSVDILLICVLSAQSQNRS